MSELFAEAVRQFGLPVALLMVGLVIVAKWGTRKDAENRAQLLKEIEELKTERNYYRDRWIETLGAAEVGHETAQRLAGGRKRPGGP